MYINQKQSQTNKSPIRPKRKDTPPKKNSRKRVIDTLDKPRITKTLNPYQQFVKDESKERKI